MKLGDVRQGIRGTKPCSGSRPDKLSFLCRWRKKARIHARANLCGWCGYVLCWSFSKGGEIQQMFPCRLTPFVYRDREGHAGGAMSLSSVLLQARVLPETPVKGKKSTDPTKCEPRTALGDQSTSKPAVTSLEDCDLVIVEENLPKTKPDLGYPVFRAIK